MPGVGTRVVKGHDATSTEAFVTALRMLLRPAFVGPIIATWAAPAFSTKYARPVLLFAALLLPSISCLSWDICRLTWAQSLSVPLCFGTRERNSPMSRRRSSGFLVRVTSNHFFFASGGRFAGIEGSPSNHPDNKIKRLRNPRHQYPYRRHGL